MKDIDLKDYKRYGFISQKQPGMYVMRLRNVAGNTTADKMRKIAELAEKYGRGQLHFTTRQAIEIHWVKEEDFPKLLEEILDAGLLPAVCGPRVRTVVTCPGNETCKFGLVNTRELAETLDRLFVSRPLPAKTKFAVTGCANSCVKPQENDIGVKGVIKPEISQPDCVACGVCVKKCPSEALTLNTGELKMSRNKCLGCGWCVKACPRKAIIAGKTGYAIYVGGKIGRFPQLGQILVEMAPETDMPRYFEAILGTYEELANSGERICAVIKRVGFNTFKDRFNSKISAVQTNV